MEIVNNSEFEQALVEDISEFYDDPLGYVMYAFPWGEEGGPLEGFDGPDQWQQEQMERIKLEVQANPEDYVVRESIASGHGIGKTAEVAWIILWAMSTRPHLSGVVTANTTTQLSTKTWREVALWQKRAINGHWFKWSATKVWHKDHPETWFCHAIPNSEHNSEAFAGLHAEHSLIIYDEASAIPDKIWEVSEGAMTDPRAMWFCFGNPTRNTGRFVDCFGKDAKRWTTRSIDSRTCKMTNKKELDEWVKTYGEDSDFVRVRVRGVFPRAGSMQFVPTDIVDMAMARDIPIEAHIMLPPIMSVDVARYGDDKTIICVRQGRKVLTFKKFRELNTMEVAVEVVQGIKEFQPAIVFVDGVGVGAGVVDRVRMLGFEVIEVNAGMKPDDEEIYYNKRAEMWDRMRSWLRAGADLPYDVETRTALIGIEYGYDDKERIRLERKADMKKRGLDSPDEGDALAYTFAEVIGDLTKQYFEPDDNFEPEYA